MKKTNVNDYSIKTLEYILVVSNNETLKDLCRQELNRRLELIKKHLSNAVKVG